MKYSIDEIARMREAVVTLTGSIGAEDRLRTYMANEATVAEIEAAAQELRLLRAGDQNALQRDFTRRANEWGQSKRNQWLGGPLDTL